MGFFSRLGNRISSGLHSAARVGKKVLGNVSRVGTRIADGAEKVTNVVERIPLLGQVASPITGVVRSGIGLVRDVADAAKTAKGLIEQGEQVLEGKGDVKDLIKSGKSQLERAKNIGKDAKSVVSEARKIPSRMR
jgi:hypothetical protein